MITGLLPDETVKKVEHANQQCGWETFGGKLAMTDQRLIFQTFTFGFKQSRTEIPFSEIVSVRPCWTRFLKMVPVFPDAIAVTMRDGKEHRFTVYNRVTWIDAIQEQATGFDLETDVEEAGEFAVGMELAAAELS